MGFVMFEQDRVCVIQCDGVRSLTFILEGFQKVSAVL